MRQSRSNKKANIKMEKYKSKFKNYKKDYELLKGKSNFAFSFVILLFKF